MIPRPLPARWMRLLAVEADLPAALITLARHAPVEPEALSGESSPVLTPELQSRLNRFDALAQAYQLWWPTADAAAQPAISPPDAPLALLDLALTALEAWQREAEPLILQEQNGRAREAEWRLWAELTGALERGGGGLSALIGQSGAGFGVVRGAIFVLPREAEWGGGELPGLLMRLVRGPEHGFLLAVGPSESLEGLAEPVAALAGRPLPPVEGLESMEEPLAEGVPSRLEACRAELARLQEALREAGERHQVAHWIRAVHRLQWFFQAIPAVEAGASLAQLEGWVAPGCEVRELNAHLRRAGVRALAFLSDTGPGSPPLVLVNPWWARPFEIFPRLLGMPNRHEVDPSRLLALVVPLLFGYMFGDVGQGAVLFGVGYAWRRTLEASWLLMTGGAAAMGFGWLFGSVFCSEGILPALWLHPTSRPLDILAVSLLLGVGLITGGLVFHGLGARWRGHGLAWLRHEGGVVVLYLGALLAFFTPVGEALAAIGAVWFLLGNGLENPGALPGRLAHLIETLLQLGVNTFSFARVGAFALAHAGLAHAVVTLADLAGGGLSGGLVLIVGNALILSLEGLVVSVQTTRLILFEFFVRFLGGEGRAFRPLPPPE
ncbi:MAG: hypothetical protein HQM00_02100 [Magnetococcales bacterium]|nr:hypothetical protein [Magnetococcales bacterium]